MEIDAYFKGCHLKSNKSNAKMGFNGKKKYDAK